ncbi:hypothetical protein MHK_001217 [Candidatus Magnetomorum sp. HK-1]|nr:hypothetical protein MHK_001217 [Candidatus Magnetomorum sp. HK-1]
MRNVNDIIRIEDNKLIVDDAKFQAKQSIEIVIKKQGTDKQYRFVKSSNGNYMLN